MDTRPPAIITHRPLAGLPPRAGRLRLREASGPSDLAATQELRHLCFVERAGALPRPGGVETDAFDARCRHLMVEEAATGQLLCSFRVMELPGGAAIGQSYAAQFYDLARLARYPRPMVELGRFCIRPGTRDADVLRLAWGGLARIVDEAGAGQEAGEKAGEKAGGETGGETGVGAGMLFGCSSFAGTDPAPYRAAFRHMARVHPAPAALAPGVRASEVVVLDGAETSRTEDTAESLSARAAIPPLLRTYLGMGGWVGDHAVIDRDLGTLHVFTGVEIAAIPAARARALRAIAAQGLHAAGVEGGPQGR